MTRGSGFRPGTQGMATCGDESIVPKFWENLVGAWAPCLGYQGTRVRDRSPRKKHAALTSMDAATDWVFSGGAMAIDLDNTNDYLQISNALGARRLIENNTPFTISWWENVHSGSTGFPNRCIFQIENASPNDRMFNICRNNSASYQTICWGGSFASPASLRASGAPSLAAGVNTWIHWALSSIRGSVNAASSYTLCADGVEYAITSGGAYNTGTNNRNRWGNTALFNNPADCLLDDMLIWRGKALTAAEMNELHKLGRGGIYIPRWVDTRAVMAL